ncbi:MAG: DUF6056 family protein [Dysgonomonas sp.]
MKEVLRHKNSAAFQKALLIFFLGITFVSIYVYNILYPLWADDWLYCFIKGTGLRVMNSGDIFVSQYNHYYIWGGRIVTHTIDQFLLLFNPKLIDVLNSLVYVLFIYIAYKYTNKGKSVNAFFFLGIAALMFISQRYLFNTAVWITGSVNYLWGTLIIIGFMYPYFVYFIERKKNDSFVKSVVFLLLGIVAGWTNENTAFAMIFVLIVSCLYLWIKKIGIPKWYVAGIIGACIGFFLMIYAPGNYVRYDYEMEKKSIPFLTDIFKNRIPTLSKRYAIRMIYLTVAWVIILLILRKNRTERDEISKRKIIYSILLVIAAHAGMLSMLASPYFPHRATFGMITFMVISVGLLVSCFDFGLKMVKRTGILFLVILCLLAGYYYIWRYKHVRYLAERIEERNISFEKQLREGKKDIIFRGSIILPKEFAFEDMTDDPDLFINVGFAAYNDIHTVRVLPETDKK